MSQPEVLICDMQRKVGSALADRFGQVGWKVHLTADDAEAGYRLLVWFEPEELPKAAVLNFEDDEQLQEFCDVLREQKVAELLPVVAFVDGKDERRAKKLGSLGVVPVPRSGDPWQALVGVLQQRQLLPRATPAANLQLRADLHESLNHQHADTAGGVRNTDSTTSKNVS